MLTQEQVRQYRENGFVLVQGVYDLPFVEDLRREADAVIARSQKAPQASFLWGGKWASGEERSQSKLYGTHEMEYHSGAFTRALLHPAMLDAVEGVLGPNIQLHHSKLVYKPPHQGGRFPLHQDHPFFPHEKHTMLAVSVHLDDTTVENGCLLVVPGSNRLGPLKHISDGGNYLSDDEWPASKATPMPAKAGDALIFNYLTVHGSPPNGSDRQRRNILFQLRDPTDFPLDLVHLSNGQGLMLRGINPNWHEVKRWRRTAVEGGGLYDQGR